MRAPLSPLHGLAGRVTAESSEQDGHDVTPAGAGGQGQARARQIQGDAASCGPETG
jgi:hypothetical protein